MDAPAALHGGATGGDERRHIASALHRGSEGAPAISMNPLRTQPIAEAAFHQTVLSYCPILARAPEFPCRQRPIAGAAFAAGVRPSPLAGFRHSFHTTTD